MEFEYKGYKFAPYRNFNETESENFWQFVAGEFTPAIRDFHHASFYAAAEAAGHPAVDIYLCDGEYVVPCSNLVYFKPTDIPEHYIRYKEITLDDHDDCGDNISDLLAAMDDTGIKDFYPTPKAVAERMLDTHAHYNDELWRRAWKPLKSGGAKTILEPSAGRGDLAAAIKERFDSYHLHLDCIEINPDLQAVLKGKGFRVVHDDFLTFESDFRYDLIVMNPPFSEAVKHVRKAMRLQARNGGMVIALVNAETVRNPYTQERKLLMEELAEMDAEITFIKNGFSNAVRATDVEIAMIKVKMSEPKLHESDIFTRLTKEATFDVNNGEGTEEKTLLPYDFILNKVQNYNVEIKAGLELYRIYNELKPHILPSFGDEVKKFDKDLPMLTLAPGDINDYIRSVRNKYWRAALKNPEVWGRMTSNMQHEWENRLKQLVEYDFTEHNINAVFREMLAQLSQGVEDSILAYFDEFTRFAQYDGSTNVHYFNGWKTNKAYKVNKKVILPCYGVVRDKKTESWAIQTYGLLDTRRAAEKLADIEKAFNFLDDGTTYDVDMHRMLELASKGEKTRGIQTKYFEVSFFKKGTMHITFYNQKLLDAFNIYGARKRNWLPETYGHKIYEDMAEEEQAVIDSFQGKDAYAEVLANKQYFLQAPERENLMLGA